MKQVDPRFCNPRKPMVVCGLISRRLRKRRSAIASLVFGSHGMNGTLIPRDLYVKTISSYLLKGYWNQQMLTLFTAPKIEKKLKLKRNNKKRRDDIVEMIQERYIFYTK